MRNIPCVVIEGVNTPSEPLPQDAKMIVCDGTQYVIYEDSDELPIFSYDEPVTP